MILYPLEAFVGTILTIVAVVSFHRDPAGPRSARLLLYSAALMMIGTLLATTQAAPTMLSVSHLSDAATLQHALNGFELWGGIREVCQVLAFLANLWALVALVTPASARGTGVVADGADAVSLVAPLGAEKAGVVRVDSEAPAGNTVMHRSRILLSLTIGLALLAACGGSSAGTSIITPTPAATGAPDGGVASGAGTTVAVIAKDLSFTLNTSQARAGTIIFTIRNDGPSAHDFQITGAGVKQTTAPIPAGQTASLTADLKAGSYSYICTVPGHALHGMKGSFTVT